MAAGPRARAVASPLETGHPGRRLPSVDEVLRSLEGRAAVARFGRQSATAAVRAELEARRLASAEGLPSGEAKDDLGEAVIRRLEQADRPSQRRVFNLTGTVLHTNLGRAVLAEEAIDAAVEPCATRRAGIRP